MRDLAEFVAGAFHTESHIRFLETRKEVVHAFSSSEKLHEVFGPQDYVALGDGIARMAEWAKAKGPRTTKPFTGIEVLRNLPPSWKAALEGR